MSNLDYVYDKIESKKTDYQDYNFTQTENSALKSFFDLAQEFDNIEDFNNLCVAIPKAFFNVEARLYLFDPKLNNLTLAAMTEEGSAELHSAPPDDVKPSEDPYYTPRNSLILTIRGKEPLIEKLPFEIHDDVLGFLEIYPGNKIDKHLGFFLQKYANRIGFNIHNRFLVKKNLEHLRFIRNLVADIEHNIIVPNMVYKLFLRGLRRKILKNKEMELLFEDKSTTGKCDEACMKDFLDEMSDINQGLMTELENLEKHYKNMSLFIETLFRKSHFDQGQLTLRTKPCNMLKDVVQPQLDRYIEQFRKMGISINVRLSGIPDEEMISVVDVGLIAQVYANLFSNAIKYTQEVSTGNGEMAKYITYGHEVIRDYFGPGKDGVKYNVFSTGPHVPPGERENLFDEGYRGTNVSSQPGSGHGLSFIKNVIEIHGGVVGYEPTQYGNNFYFILPKS